MAASGRVKNEERITNSEELGKNVQRSTLNAQRSTLKFGRGKRRLALAMKAGKAVSPRPPPIGRADARLSRHAEIGAAITIHE